MTRHHGGDGPCRWCYGTGLKRYADKPGLFYCHCAAGRKAQQEDGKVGDPPDEVRGFPV